MANNFFEMDFEKGMNFKNFYPNANISSVLEIHKKIRKKRKTVILIKKPASPRNMKKIKGNKIVPSPINNDRHQSLVRQDSSHRRESDKFSNIFLKKPELSSFFKKQRFSFYDVVNEVLYNQDLRKKLQNIKQKHSKPKKIF